VSLTKHSRKELKELLGNCGVSWGASETIVIQCATEAEPQARAYIKGKGYSIKARQHPCKKDVVAADLAIVILTGEKELAQ
jgi:hypothetical protein